MKVPLVLLLSLLATANCISFQETFENDNGWVHAEKSGKMILAGGGYKTSQDASFYHVSKKIGDKTVGESDLVLSFSVRHPQNIDCGGGYLKFLPDLDQAGFNGDSAYKVMFGPDICGATKKIHLIFSYKGKNLLWKKEPRCESDTTTHWYTLHVHQADDTYEVFVDFVKKESGKLEDDWDMLPPKMIADPSDQKPSDWVDESEIVDPNDVKPADWDTEPATIADPDATKPDDWDEEEDGAWEAPTVPNPKYKGEWKAKRIPNPKYKGEWKAKQIPNPEYSPADLSAAVTSDIAVVGVDVWQVKSGSIFDNIVVADNFEAAKKTYDPKKKDAEAEEEKKAAPQAEKAEEEEEEEEEEHDEL